MPPASGLDGDLPRGLVHSRDLPEDEVGVRAHHPERNDDVARLESPRGGLWQRGGVEHEVLAADDGAAGLAEQPADIGAGEPAAQYQRPALRVPVLH
jgi:hypothetical protein